MSTIVRNRRITMTFRERGPTGRPTLIIDVSAEDDTLPHEHREDMKEIAAAVMGVPIKSLEGVEVQLRRVPGDHPHPHPHSHEEEEQAAEPQAAKS